MTTEAASGLGFIKFAASGRNRFVTGIALLAALGGFLFGYDTGIISQAPPFMQQEFHPSTLASSWIVAVLLIGAMVGAGVSRYLADRISRKWTKCIARSGADRWRPRPLPGGQRRVPGRRTDQQPTTATRARSRGRRRATPTSSRMLRSLGRPGSVVVRRRG